jgi:hypothetical protein
VMSVLGSWSSADAETWEPGGGRRVPDYAGCRLVPDPGGCRRVLYRVEDTDPAPAERG